MAKVLVSAPLAGGSLERLRAHDVTVGARATGLGKEAILAQIGPCEALIALLSDRIDREVLDAAPKLRVIANHAVGVDNIDLAACRERGVVVTNTPGVLADATADLTMGLILSACRRIAESDRIARSGAWEGWSPTDMLGMRVTGSTLGLIGCGKTGQAVARRAQGFGMQVLYAQRHALPIEVERDLSLARVSLGVLLSESDVVSLHCPLTEETRGLISRERLLAMKRGAVLINTARGGCVDTLALADALRSGHLGGAGIDVFEDEPTIPEVLRGLDRVVLTTHIGSADEPTREAMGSMCVDSVLAVLEGKEATWKAL